MREVYVWRLVLDASWGFDGGWWAGYRAGTREVAGLELGLGEFGGAPGFGVLPTDVGRVVEMKQEAFAAVKEADAEDVVPDEGEDGDEGYVPDEGGEGAAGFSFGDKDLSAQGAVAVHVLEVALEGGVGVVDEIAFEGFELAGEGDGLVDGAVSEAGAGGEVGGVAAEEAEFGVGIVATAADPPIEEDVAAAEEEGVR